MHKFCAIIRTIKFTITILATANAKQLANIRWNSYIVRKKIQFELNNFGKFKT